MQYLCIYSLQENRTALLHWGSILQELATQADKRQAQNACCGGNFQEEEIIDSVSGSVARASFASEEAFLTIGKRREKIQ